MYQVQIKDKAGVNHNDISRSLKIVNMILFENCSAPQLSQHGVLAVCQIVSTVSSCARIDLTKSGPTGQYGSGQTHH